jgi:hypothetical protein
MSPHSDSENDYEIVGTGGGTKPGGVVSVRLKPEEMELLMALAEVGGRTLSDTLRLGLRCLGDQPAKAAGPAVLRLRLDTHTSQAVSSLPGQAPEWSESSPSRVNLVLA